MPADPDDSNHRPAPDEPLIGEVVRPSADDRQRGAVFTNAPLASAVTRKHSFARLLVGANIAVYVMMVLSGVSAFSPTAVQLVHWGALFGPIVHQGQWWRLITAGFVHIGIIHIAFNMWCLWYLAELSEFIFGGWTTVAIYVLTAITSSMLSLFLHPQIISAGASGAIFGIAGAIIIALRVGHHTVPEPVRRAISNSALRFAAYNLVFGLLPGIDDAGHFGGLFGGLALGAAYAITQSMPSQEDRREVRAAISVAFLALLISITIGPLHVPVHLQFHR